MVIKNLGIMDIETKIALGFLFAFADKINDGCNGAITATIEGDQLIKGLHRARCTAIIK